MSQLTNDLQYCETVAEMLQYLLDNYDLENCRPGFATKIILVNGLEQAVKLIQPQRK
jgi:hypothetical protein